MDNPMKSRILTVTFWLVLPLSAFVVMSQNFSELESPGAMAADNRCDRFIQTAEDLWMQNNFEGSDAALQKARGICPERAEIYWRLARNGYNRLEDIPRDQKPAPRKLFEIYGRLERQADKCIAVDPRDGNCYLWKALCLGNRMMYQSNIKNIPLVAGLEATIKRGLALRPAYRSTNGAFDSLGDLYSMLGAFYRILPEWLCAFPFKQIVGTCGDLNQAVAFQKEAVAREPRRIEYLIELGANLLCRGQKRNRPEDLVEARKILTDLQSRSSSQPVDLIDQDHARMLLVNPELACDYSRAAQVKVSKEVFKKKL